MPKFIDRFKSFFSFGNSLVSRTWGSKTSASRQVLYNLAWYTYNYDYIKGKGEKHSEELGFEHINYVRDILARIINHFTAKGFTIIAERRSETLNLKELKDLQNLEMENIITEDISEKRWYKEYMLKTKYLIPYLEKFWRFNQAEGKTFRSLVEYATVSGDLFIYVSPDEEESNVRMTLYDAEHVTIIPDEFNIHKIKKAIVEYEYEDEFGEKHSYKLVADKEQVSITEDGRTTVTKHSLNEVPLVHIAFNRTAKSIYGVSDVFKILAGSLLFNSKISDISEIISYHASPITIVKGARIGNLEKSPNKIWSGIPKDADIFNLSMDADLQNSLTLIDKIESYICTAAAYPKEILAGNVKMMSHTAGVSMQYVYKPLEDSLIDKEDAIREGFNRLHRLVLKMLDGMNIIDLSDFSDINTTVKFNPRLPKDELYEMQIITQELIAGITSLHEAMRRRGKTNTEGILKERWEEAIWSAKLEDITTSIAGEPINSDVDKNRSSELREKFTEALNKNVGNIKAPTEQQKQEEKNTEE